MSHDAGITLRQRVKEDIDTAIARDPAARSRFEVFWTYPGLHALWWHRVAHRLWQVNAYFLARVIAMLGRRLTGVEIHPAAQIGRRLFIDHGMGVVIGETAIVGDDALIFHGVTLGGAKQVDGRRHPIVGDRVLIGAGAKLLGAITIGDDARIGANAVVLRDVPAGATAVGVPAKVSTNALPADGADDAAMWI